MRPRFALLLPVGGRNDMQALYTNHGLGRICGLGAAPAERYNTSQFRPQAGGVS